ncbi:hypothetical protein IEQ34_012863 [Dendrobium chrysotoxum]|uniref:Uncharacterized protein n=1 Tax=Dendrobium chrysotoxum TaxID=161865 RepID=A0AAV7GPU7_DENCH|nr:hypothetical protein IEQ34_012863 [Dendrobium chrysotoxum]
MAAEDTFASASAALYCISLPPPPSLRRLWSNFSEPTRPIVSTRRGQPFPSQSAYGAPWATLQGGLVGETEATSLQIVGKGLDLAEAVAWELFTPLHRALLVAIIAIASAETRRSQRISQLQRTVEIRDEALKNIQAKLDDLCEQMRFIKDQYPTPGCRFLHDNEHFIIGEMTEANEDKFGHRDTRLLHLSPDSGIAPLCSSQSIKTKDVYMNEMSKGRLSVNNHEIASELEERRMSDLSDFCCSVASSADFQPVELSTLAAEQELYNLRNECEEKDANIKELTATAHASSVAYSKRIAELEEVIRRKNMITTKLRKDMLFLEQQISKLSRLRRKSSPSSSMVSATKQLPRMTENILYDMSSTSSSSSDRDSPDRDRVNPVLLRSMEHSRQVSAMPLSSFVSKEQRPISPLKENRMSRKVEANSTVRQSQFEANPVVRQRKLVSPSMDNKKARRKSLKEDKNMKTSQKKTG